jgi:hypothetical protein
MKRIYRPFHHRLLPLDVIDFWQIFILVIGLLIYVAWRWT